jgi:hypothetical protein
MDEEKISRKLPHGRMEGKRRRGRPKKRRLQNLEDHRVMQVGRWWEKVQLERMEVHCEGGQSSHRAVVPKNNNLLKPGGSCDR